MPERTLSNEDLNEMKIDSDDSKDLRKGDRRKAINTSVEPQHDRRQYFRRSEDRK